MVENMQPEAHRKRTIFFKGSTTSFQHRAPLRFRVIGSALGASMWFWVMYRAKKDGAVLLGWKHPWDH